MGEFNTQLTMRDIFRKISETQPHLSDLYCTTFYYRKLVRMLREQSKLVLFGAGKYGEIVFAALEQEGIDTIQCFCDNNDRVVETSVHGLKVLSPQDALKYYPDACFVITPKDYENEILRQLIHMGVDIENIVIFNIKNTGLMVEI